MKKKLLIMTMAVVVISALALCGCSSQQATKDSESNSSSAEKTQTNDNQSTNTSTESTNTTAAKDFTADTNVTDLTKMDIADCTIKVNLASADGLEANATATAVLINKVDDQSTYQATAVIDKNSSETINVPSGSYEYYVIVPINPDGSTYKFYSDTLTVNNDTNSLDISLDTLNDSAPSAYFDIIYRYLVQSTVTPANDADAAKLATAVETYKKYITQ